MNTLENEASTPLEVNPEAHDEAETEEECSFINSMMTLHSAQCDTLEELIKATQAKLRWTEKFLEKSKNLSRKAMRRHARKYSDARTERIRLHGRLEQLLTERGEFDTKQREKWRDQYRAIVETPRILAVHVENERVVWRTDVLFGKDMAHRWHRIGPYEISCNAIHPALSTIRWKNLDGPKKLNQSSLVWGPPNIFSHREEDDSGSVSCAGEVANDHVNSAARSHDFVLLTWVVVRYPECPGGPQNENMQKWPIVPASEVPQWYIETFGE